MKKTKRKKKYTKYYFGIVAIAVLFFSVSYLPNINLSGIKNLAGVFFTNSITVQSIQKDYSIAKTGKKLRILIVPGHDIGHGGTEFRGIKERDLNIKIAERLTQLLRRNNRFEVFLTKNDTGYLKSLQTYIKNNHKQIEDFRDKYKKTMDSLIKQGLVDTRNKIEHNNAPSDTAIRLYGINKWANDNNIDIIIHVHLNDYRGRRYNQSGKYSGFAIYVPEKQFSNAKASLILAKDVLKRLSRYLPTSNMPEEKAGIIGDQELIADGSYNTLDSAVLLIEYGYIYEAQFMSPKVRNMSIDELAMQTYLGVLDFINQEPASKKNKSDIAFFPYTWKNNLKEGMRGNKDIFALQTALNLQSLYPPTQDSKNECPINGNFGPCTTSAVENFQKKYNIKPVSGFVGPITRSRLNTLYSK